MFKSMVVSFYLSALFPLSQRLMLTARTGLCGELRQMLPQLFFDPGKSCPASGNTGVGYFCQRLVRKPSLYFFKKRSYSSGDRMDWNSSNRAAAGSSDVKNRPAVSVSLYPVS